MQMVAAPSRTVLCRAPSGAIAHSRRERAPCVACGIPRAPVLAHARCRCSRVRYFVERECVTCSVTWLPMVVVICYMCPIICLHHRWAFCAYERLARLRVARARRSGGCAVFPPGYRAAPPIRYRSCERCGTGARVFSHFGGPAERGAGPPVPAPARGAGSRPVTGARPGGEGDSVERVRKAASGGSLPQAYQLLPAYYHTLLKRPNIYFERESELFAR